jgi:hypothetical protein
MGEISRTSQSGKQDLHKYAIPKRGTHIKAIEN